MAHVDDLEHRFLSLTGVIAESDHVRHRIHPELESIKTRYFDSHPDEPVVLHRKELVNATWPFQALMDLETRAVFDAEMLGLIRDWDYRVITVCLDKHAFVSAGLNATNDPYHYCLSILVELFCNWLNRCQSKGDVMVETRGNKEDKKLKEHFRMLWEDGTARVAIADLIAHPLRNDILKEHGLLHRPLAPYAMQILTVLETKYCQENGVIVGKRFVP